MKYLCLLAFHNKFHPRLVKWINMNYPSHETESERQYTSA